MDITIKQIITFHTMEMNKELIDRFYNGECTEKEVHEIMNWMHSDLSEVQLSKEVETNWQDADSEKQQGKGWDIDLISTKILHKIFEETNLKTNSRVKVRRWIAAAIFIIIFSTGTYFVINNYDQHKATNESIAFITKQNPKGQKSRVFLPDGSVVWLNSESELTYPERFNESNRQINLVGEAFFEVTKDHHKPFIVNAGNTATRVLGTKFNVEAYPEISNVIITLEEGKVIVDQTINGNKNSLSIQPGEGVIASQTETKMRKFDYDPLQHLAWKDGVLHFHKADIMTVIKSLERWYGVNIIIHNFKKDDWSFTGSFRNEYLSNVLMNLSYTKEFSYEIDDKNVILNIK